MEQLTNTPIIREADLQEVIHAERLRKELHANSFLSLLIDINTKSHGRLKEAKGGVAV